jgi:uncharacterized protein HemX
MAGGSGSEWAVSKATGLLAAILTVLSIVCGGVYWIVHQNDILAQGQALNTQAIQNNTAAIKALDSKHRQGDKNFDRLVNLITQVEKAKQRGGAGAP